MNTIETTTHMLSYLSLTPQEAERLSYISDVSGGSRGIIDAALDDLTDSLEEEHEAALEEARKESFELGKLEGMGVDAVSEREELNACIDTHQRTIDAHAKLLKSIYHLFTSNQLKLAPDRKQFEKEIRQSARNLGVWL